MKEREAQLVAELLERAQEDRPAKTSVGELPEELAFREGRLEKIREAMAAWKPRRRRLPNRQLRPKVVSARMCPTTRS